MNLLINCLAVGAGGFAGALCRFGVAAASNRLFGTRFPFGTLLINLSGSFVLGWFLARVARGWQVASSVQLAVTVGFLGAYTTFSTFMFESDAMIRSGTSTRAALYIVASILVGLLAVRTGILLGQR
jgi:fluoride exporter